MGQPRSLSTEQICILRDAARPLIVSESLIANNGLKTEISVNPNGIIFFEIRKIDRRPDRGYVYPVK